jgi:3-oxoacyl-[acyl-carrier protein] reductase
VAFQGSADYAATKAAVVGYTKGAAKELGQKGITVNVVQPGIIETDMSKDFLHLLDMITEGLAIKRIGKTEDMAAGILFLAGPEASYITGSVLDIDGGYSS